MSRILLCLYTSAVIIASPMNLKCFTTTQDSTMNYATSQSVYMQVQSTQIIWKYKVENGVLWKRKYDCLLNRYIGDWIRA